jgi:F-box protein 21
LIAHNLTGVKSERTYKDLQNNFIAIALQDEDHPSVPLISVAVFCCVARRFGLDARPCGIPFHVYAMVFPTKGSTLDGKVLQAGEAGNHMYLDPFRSAQETPIDSIKAQLSEIGAVPSSHSTFLQYSTTTEIVLRSGRNIMNSVKYAHQSAVVQHTNHGSHHLTMVSDFPDMEAHFMAHYGLQSFWAYPQMAMVCSCHCSTAAVSTLHCGAFRDSLFNGRYPNRALHSTTFPEPAGIWSAA